MFFSVNLAMYDKIITTIIVVLFYVLTFLCFKRKIIRIVHSILSALLIASIWLELSITSLALGGSMLCILIITGIINANAFRNEIANPSKNVKTFKWFSGNKFSDNVAIDDETVMKEICEAITLLSKSKTGALITFERKDSLDNYMKTGSIIDAPVTKEIIQTIFYPGTRLHDGGIVIRNNIIVSASVYYTPTTKPLAGKYGARHRAAMGISEITDSITVVVSEETGRISIAVNGELESVALDNVKRVLEDYINLNEV